MTEAQVESSDSGMQTQKTPARDWRFWMIILSICISSFLVLLELTTQSSVRTALPRILNELHREQFVWVGSAYALASTAFLPFTGSLAQVFGQKLVMLGSLFFFTLDELELLDCGRTIQGLGGGGIASLSLIILSDLVTLREHGTFTGLIVIAWAAVSGVGPIIGGSLAEHGQWRWLFYLNIPICVVAAELVSLFLDMRTSSGAVFEKLCRMDCNVLVIASTTSVVIALTWGGIQYSWSSATILAPLLLGFVGLGAFLTYEWRFAKSPMVPFILMSTRTGLFGYIQTFVTPVIFLSLIYYVPVYFQACKNASLTRSGIYVFSVAFMMAPLSFITGILVTKTNHYRPQVWIGWALLMIGTSLLSKVEADTNVGKAVGYQVFIGCGAGILWMVTYFPVLAPVPVSENACALTFFYFFRQFAMIWGITIGGSILQNQLQTRLPPDYTTCFPQGTEIAYASIPEISNLPQPLKDEVWQAFACSLQVIWKVATGIGVLGFLASLGMKHLPLHRSVDED